MYRDGLMILQSTIRECERGWALLDHGPDPGAVRQLEDEPHCRDESPAGVHALDPGHDADAALRPWLGLIVGFVIHFPRQKPAVLEIGALHFQEEALAHLGDRLEIHLVTVEGRVLVHLNTDAADHELVPYG